MAPGKPVLKLAPQGDDYGWLAGRTGAVPPARHHLKTLNGHFLVSDFFSVEFGPEVEALAGSEPKVEALVGGCAGCEPEADVGREPERRGTRSRSTGFSCI